MERQRLTQRKGEREKQRYGQVMEKYLSSVETRLSSHCFLSHSITSTGLKYLPLPSLTHKSQ